MQNRSRTEPEQIEQISPKIRRKNDDLIKNIAKISKIR
jgi:hypothetical protein